MGCGGEGEGGRGGDAVGERVDGVINTNLNDGRRGQRAKPASVYGTRGGEEQGVRGGGESWEALSPLSCAWNRSAATPRTVRWNNRRRKRIILFCFSAAELECVRALQLSDTTHTHTHMASATFSGRRSLR